MKIRLSVGSAALLGLKKLKIKTPPTTIYLMNTGGCTFNCAFCAQAKDSSSREDKLSRVSWPEYDLEEVLRALEVHQDKYKRICFQVVNEAGFLKNLPKLIHEIKKRNKEVKIAINIRTQDMNLVDELISNGTDKIGLSIDIADSIKFKKIKGGDLEMFKTFVETAAKKYRDKIATHLIVGMGETDIQLVGMMKDLHSLGVIIALFAFTQVKGAGLETLHSPSISRYRKIQVALHLIRNNIPCNFAFSENHSIINYGIPEEKLFAILKDSNVFETSGCSGCNRPYYNERAGGDALYNSPSKVEEQSFIVTFKSILNS